MAAYVTLIGGSAEAAGEAAGCSERAVRSWRHSPWWQDALDEAEERWLNEAKAAARNGLLYVLSQRDPATIRWALERLVDELAPPPRRVSVMGDSSFTVEIGGLPEAGPTSSTGGADAD